MTTGHWDTETETTNHWPDFSFSHHDDDEHSNVKSVDAHKFLFWIVLVSYFNYHYQKSPYCGHGLITCDFLL